MKSITTLGLASAAVCLMFAMPAQGQTQSAAPSAQVPSTTTTTGTAKKDKVKVLGNTVCPVSGENIIEEAGSLEKAPKIVYKGYQVNLCCKMCLKKFNAKPDFYLKRAKDSVKKKGDKKKETAELTPLNNAKCPISGEAVGSMEEGASVAYKGYEIGLCCKGCVKKFNANPDAYLQSLLKAKNTKEGKS